MHTFLIAQNTFSFFFFFLFFRLFFAETKPNGRTNTFTGMVSGLADDSLQEEKLRFLLWEPIGLVKYILQIFNNSNPAANAGPVRSCVFPKVCTGKILKRQRAVEIILNLLHR